MSENKITKERNASLNKSKSYKDYYSMKKMSALRFEYENGKNPPLKKFWNSVRRNFEVPFVKSTFLFHIAFIVCAITPLMIQDSESALFTTVLALAAPFVLIYAGYCTIKDQMVVVPLYMKHIQRGDGHTPLSQALISNDAEWIKNASPAEYREGRKVNYSLLMNLICTWESSMSLDPEESEELRKQLLEIVENLPEDEEKAKMLEDWMRVVRINNLDNTGKYAGIDTAFTNKPFDNLINRGDEDD